ncbi:MAG: hypothetical protein V9H25_08110 [Candidatus Competibacter sp.]|jgi:hypothetical protein
MPLSANLLRELSKGRFPLFSSSGIPLWRELVNALKVDAKKTVAEIKTAMQKASRDYDDYYPSEIEVNSVLIHTGQDDVDAFLGQAHSDLCKDFGIASRPAVQACVQDIRDVMRNRANPLPESQVVLGLDAHHRMGTGLIADPLTCLPDHRLRVTFGSVPDQDEIGRLAPVWNILKRRAYENQGVLTQYGAKPHYVLAHLLNHNLNGSGEEPKNMVPFWAASNTQMAKQAEKYVKELVLQGVEVKYNITCGQPVGMTPGRLALQPLCDPEQWELVEAEQWLPRSFIITCDAWDSAQNDWVRVVNETIDNYVPETVPYLL